MPGLLNPTEQRVFVGNGVALPPPEHPTHEKWHWFPHEVGPGFTQLFKWWSSGALLDFKPKHIDSIIAERFEARVEGGRELCAAAAARADGILLDSFFFGRPLFAPAVREIEHPAQRRRAGQLWFEMAARRGGAGASRDAPARARP